MTMFSYDKAIAITNEALLLDGVGYTEQISRIFSFRPKAVILREKQMTEEAYKKLALEVLEMGTKHNVDVILHKFINIARDMDYRKIHISMDQLRNMSRADIMEFKDIGVSIHSVNEAIEAEKRGVTYLIAGHIFETDCKPGLEPRGIKFLSQVIASTSLPVYAIGGITPNNFKEIMDIGAAGGCMMSYFMKKCNDVL